MGGYNIAGEDLKKKFVHGNNCKVCDLLAFVNSEDIKEYLMKLDYDNRRTRTAGQPFSSEAPEEKTPMEILEELYEKQNGGPMSSRQRVLAGELIEKIWEDEP